MTIAKVLIVENDEFNARHLRNALQKLDYEICAVLATGESVLKNLLQLQPDFILMDISLDGDLDGIETATQITEIRPTPLIYLSGYTDDATLKRARQTKPYGYLVKPYSEQTLNATLQMLMERLQTEHILQKSESRLREAALVFDTTQDGILILDAERKVSRSNQRFTEITGFESADITGSMPAFLNREVLTPALFEQIDAGMQSDRWSGHIDISKKGGGHFPANLTIASVREVARSGEHTNLTQYVVLISDLTAVRMAEDKLYRMAHHDPLTGLPNRQLAMDRLQQAIEQAKRRRSRMAVFFVDLDNFKHVNDSLGHNAGDDLLRTVATRMEGCVRSVDTVARLGGDEFLVILDNVDDIKTVSGIAEKMLAALSSPFTSAHAPSEIIGSASIGISVFPEAGKTAEQLIRAADTAMYHAKSRGRCKFAFYTLRMTYSAAQRIQLKHEFQNALEQHQLELHYQPQLKMSQGELVGLEALLRWRHPRRGLLTAEDIIPLAETADCMRELGVWVLRNVCAQLRDWRARGFKVVKISINCSASQFFNSTFTSTIEHCLDEFTIEPNLLEVEITETTLHEEKSHEDVFDQLKMLGVGLAIDHFGTGHFSVNALKRLAITRVKIDRKFVSGISRNGEDTAIINAILAMTKELNLISVAEGIETSEQNSFLLENGCEEAQGYFYAGALPAKNIEPLLQPRIANRSGH